MLGDEDSPVVEFTVSFESNLLLLFVISSSNVVVGSWYALFLSVSNLLVPDSLLFALCRVSEISRDFTVFPISLSTCGPSVFSHSVPLSSTCPWPSSNPLSLLSGSLSALTSASSLSSYVSFHLSLLLLLKLTPSSAPTDSLLVGITLPRDRLRTNLVENPCSLALCHRHST